jgi:hypothetical protein
VAKARRWRLESEKLDVRGFLEHKPRFPMANRAIWSVRKRHEWLSTPLKPRRVKRAVRLRCGLQDALDRKAAKEPAAEK